MTKSSKSPGKSHRNGITMLDLAEMFPDEESARQWFESKMWPEGRRCPRCNGGRTVESTHSKMPYWCSDCRKYFSVRTNTLLESSRLPLRKWAWAIFLHLTSLKGVSSMKLHRDIGVTQSSAWFMLQRIREAFDDNDDPPFSGPVEVDESYFGGRERNKHESKRTNAGRGPIGKTAVVGAKDRETGKVKARVVASTDKETLRLFVEDSVEYGATLYTDGATAYDSIADLLNGLQHEAVNHSVGEYVRGMAHTNGVESFWAMLKRGFHGTYHRMSPKHLHRYVAEFAGRQGIRDMDTIDQMSYLVRGMSGKRLRYSELIA